MKKFIVILLVSLTMFACKKEDETQPANPLTSDQYTFVVRAYHMTPLNGRVMNVQMYDINTGQYLIGHDSSGYQISEVHPDLDATYSFTINYGQQISFSADIYLISNPNPDDSLDYTVINIKKNGVDLPGIWNSPSMNNQYHNW